MLSVKILDKYILKTFLKTFLSIFFILIFIFILQSVWAFVKELAGKDLDLIIVGKFLMYLLPTLVPLILPLTILLASIMVFGDFAENYEFAAMKSAGISLQRAMRGLSIFIFFLSIVTFFFANNVIPWGEYQSRNLRRNIAKLTPAMAIAEGQFNPIGDINIKVDKKSGENGNHLEGVILHMKKNGKNTTVIKAKSGDLVPGAKNSNVLQLILYNGNYYNDIFNRLPKKRERNPHAKSAFEKYTMNIDLSKLNDVDLDKENKGVSYKMLKINQLIPVIDSLEQKRKSEVAVDVTNTINSLNIFKRASTAVLPIDKVKLDPKFKQEKIPNSLKKGILPIAIPKLAIEENLLLKGEKIISENQIKIKKIKDITPVFKGDYLKIFTPKEKEVILNFAITNAKTKYKQIEASEKINLFKKVNLNQHKMALHKKFALAFSCFILFFVGAPLGAIIRKGGMGLPMVIAMGLFLSYYFIGIFAQNSAESGSISPFLGAWLSTLILLPLGVMLTRNATSDKGVFNTDPIVLFFENIWNKISKKKNRATQKNDLVEGEKINQLIKAPVLSLDTANYTVLYKKYTTTSLIAFLIFTLLFLILVVFSLLLKQSFTKIIITIFGIATVVYVLFYVKTFSTYLKLTKFAKPNNTKLNILIEFFFGITANSIAYFYHKKEVAKNIQNKDNLNHDNSK